MDRHPRAPQEPARAPPGLRASGEGRPDLDLVLVGPEGWGDDAEERTLAAELPGRVHVLGRLPDEELAAAYAGARAFAFPSI